MFSQKQHMTAEQIIELLCLEPHPEGGFFVETYREKSETGERGACTAIYFLLKEGEVSHWHRVDASEIWHHYAGAPLELSTAKEGEKTVSQVLGSDLMSGERPQLVVAPFEWQSARTLGAWTLVGCTVSPAFEFAHFELAEPDWSPSC